MTHPPLLSALVGDPEIETYFTDTADLAAMLRFETALAEAQADVGSIPRDHAARIASVCRSFEPRLDRLAASLTRDGVVVPEFVSQLRAAVGEPASRSLHKGATQPGRHRHQPDAAPGAGARSARSCVSWPSTRRSACSRPVTAAKP